MSGEADGNCDYYRSKTRRARKHHWCSACKRAIEPGHRYQEIGMKFDGDVLSYKRCGSCELTYRHLRDKCLESPDALGVDETLGCGMDYEEEWGGAPPSEIERLPFLTDDEAGGLL